MEIVISYCGRTQTRKLKPSVTLTRAIEILHELRDNDDLGCESFELWHGNTLVFELLPINSG